jgi:hypothetical protein
MVWAMTEPVFLIGLAIVGFTAATVVKTIVGAFRGRGESSDLARISHQLDRQAAALEDAQNTLANQETQLAELQERLDFTERMLAQGRDRGVLRPGEKE